MEGRHKWLNGEEREELGWRRKLSMIKEIIGMRITSFVYFFFKKN